MSLSSSVELSIQMHAIPYLSPLTVVSKVDSLSLAITYLSPLAVVPKVDSLSLFLKEPSKYRPSLCPFFVVSGFCVSIEPFF